MPKAQGLLAILIGAILWLGNPQAIRADNPKKAYNRGVELLDKGQLEPAKQEFQKILRRKARSGQDKIFSGLAHYRLGQILTLQGDLDGAHREVQEAIELQPDEAYWHDELAGILAKEGKVQEAIRECAEASSLSPDDAGLADGCGLPKEPASQSTEAQARQSAPKLPSSVPDASDGTVTPPIPTYKPDGEYTKKARSVGCSGSVILWFVVTAEGTVERARVTKSLGLGLDQEALRAVKTWRFKPATRSGKPVPVRVMAEMNFRVF